MGKTGKPEFIYLENETEERHNNSIQTHKTYLEGEKNKLYSRVIEVILSE